MALASLEIMFIVLIVVAIILQILLYRSNNLSNNNIIFIVNMVFVFLLSYIAFTTFPINETGKRALSIVWPILAVVGIIMKIKTKQSPMASKLFLTVATVGALVQILFI